MSESRLQKIKKTPFRQSMTKNILLILAILIVGLLILVFCINKIARHGKEYELPDFTAMTVDKAQALAHKHQFRLVVTDSIYMRNMEKGVIVRQNPVPGSKVKKERRVLLTINAIIPKQSTVPDLVGFSLRQARTELMGNGLKLGRISYVEDIATNNVLEQRYRGVRIEPGRSIDSESKIDLVLGLNPKDQNVFVPSAVGYKYNTATDILHDNSLNIDNYIFDETVETYSDSLNSYVYAQYPMASDSISVNIGSGITLYLSKDMSRISYNSATDSTDKGNVGI